VAVKEVKRKEKKGKLATACAMLCMLGWISIVILSILIGTA